MWIVYLIESSRPDFGHEGMVGAATKGRLKSVLRRECPGLRIPGDVEAAGAIHRDSIALVIIFAPTEVGAEEQRAPSGIQRCAILSPLSCSAMMSYSSILQEEKIWIQRNLAMAICGIFSRCLI